MSVPTHNPPPPKKKKKLEKKGTQNQSIVAGNRIKDPRLNFLEDKKPIIFLIFSNGELENYQNKVLIKLPFTFF
jgi:hypothetical protein